MQKSSSYLQASPRKCFIPLSYITLPIIMGTADLFNLLPPLKGDNQDQAKRVRNQTVVYVRAALFFRVS